jgi:hypothetical protein
MSFDKKHLDHVSFDEVACGHFNVIRKTKLFLTECPGGRGVRDGTTEKRRDGSDENDETTRWQHFFEESLR